MFAGDFARKLRKLNPELRIWCGDDATKPAGLYYVRRGEYRDICGVDKNYVPEYKVVRWNGSVVKQGWRDVLMVLIARKLVDRRKAERLFSTSFDRWSPINAIVDSSQDPIVQARNAMFDASMNHNEVIDVKYLSDLRKKKLAREKEEGELK
ncbi:MAG: hypothetical protein AB7V39_00545 [Nitrospiraceae bacterium]